MQAAVYVIRTSRKNLGLLEVLGSAGELACMRLLIKLFCSGRKILLSYVTLHTEVQSRTSSRSIL